MGAPTERSVLNHLIETCKDGERGFRKAAEHVQDPAAKQVFLEIAAQRARFAAALLPHAQRLGGAADAEGTAAGALHRGWMEVRDALTAHHVQAMVQEAARGEQAALRAYKDALDGMLPPTVRDVVEQQYADVQQAYARLQDLDPLVTHAN